MTTLPFRWNSDQCYFGILGSIPIRETRYVSFNIFRKAVKHMLDKISLIKSKLMREKPPHRSQLRKPIFRLDDNAVDQASFHKRLGAISNRPIDNGAFA